MNSQKAEPGTIAYDSLSTSAGFLWVAVSPRGIVRIEFDMPEKQFVTELQRAYGARLLRDPDAVSPVGDQLREYLSGERQRFDVPLDLGGLSAFQLRALTACSAIPYGRTLSYADLARRLGRPGAARAVGAAMAKNPIPLVIPCHRVVRSDGNPGGYGGGLPLKARLLHMEEERSRALGATPTPQTAGENAKRCDPMTFYSLSKLPVVAAAPGVRRQVVHLQRVMLTFFEFDVGATVPRHSHHHEQITYVLDGALEFTLEGETRILHAGEGATVAPHAVHSAIALAPSRVLDGWSPIRDDYA